MIFQGYRTVLCHRIRLRLRETGAVHHIVCPHSAHYYYESIDGRIWDH